MTRHVAIPLAVLLMLVLAAGWALRRGTEGSGAAAPAATAATAPAGATTPAAAPVPPVRPTATAAPLPPPGAEPADIVPGLRERANAGDRRAACRLAAELLRCEGNEFRIAFDQRHDESFRSDYADRPDILDATDEARIRRLQRKQACDRLPAGWRREGRHWLEAAARAGEPEAMVRYASGEQWGMSAGGFLGDPGFERWRRDAPAMMRAAMRAGMPEAVFPLMSAYGDDFGLLPGLVADDPERARAYELLHLRLRGRAEGTSRVDAAAESRAQRLAQRWHRQYFDGRQFAADTVLLTPFGFETDAADEPVFCRDRR